MLLKSRCNQGFGRLCFCLEDTGSKSVSPIFSDSRGCLLPIFKEHDLNLAFILPVCSSDWLMWGPFPLWMRFPTFPSGELRSLSLQWVITWTAGSPSHLLEPTVQAPFCLVSPLFLPCPFTFSRLWLLLGPRSMLHPLRPPHGYNFVSASLENKPSNYFKSTPSVSCWNLFRFSNLITPISAKTPRFPVPGLHSQLFSPLF